jgi:hypothetical protein
LAPGLIFVNKTRSLPKWSTLNVFYRNKTKSKLARMFIRGEPFTCSLLFTSKAGAYPDAFKYARALIVLPYCERNRPSKLEYLCLRTFMTSLIFASRAGAYPSVAPLKILLDWLRGANFIKPFSLSLMLRRSNLGHFYLAITILSSLTFSGN